MSTKALGIACLVAIACTASTAAADLLTFEYTGQVLDVNPPFDSIVDLGDPVSGSFSFDTTAPDTDPDPVVGVYSGATQSFTIGSYSGAPPVSRIRITNDLDIGGGVLFDGYEVLAIPPLGLDPIGGNPVVQQSFAIYGDGDLLTSTELGPPPALDSMAIDSAYLLLGVLPEGSGTAYQYGDAETLPEADAVGAAIAASLAMASLRRIRARAKTASE